MYMYIYSCISLIPLNSVLVCIGLLFIIIFAIYSTVLFVHTHTHSHKCTRAHTHTHKHTHTHTHTEITALRARVLELEDDLESKVTEG